MQVDYTLLLLQESPNFVVLKRTDSKTIIFETKRNAAPLYLVRLGQGGLGGAMETRNELQKKSANKQWIPTHTSTPETEELILDLLSKQIPEYQIQKWLVRELGISTARAARSIQDVQFNRSLRCD